MASDITPEMARAELARRRQVSGGGAAAPVASPSITPEAARAELARRRAAAAPEQDTQAFEPGAYGGAAFNTTAGVNEGLYGALGLPVDAMAGVMNAGIRGYNYVTGSDVEMIDKPLLGSEHLRETIGGVAGELHPVLDSRNTVARTSGDRLARAAGEAAGSSVVGAGAVGALARGGALSGRAAEAGSTLFGRSSSAGAVAGDAAISGAAGAGASLGADAAPDQWKPVVALTGGLLAGSTAATAAGVPGAIRGSARLAGDAVAPLTRGGQERLAARRFRAGTSNLDAALRTLNAGGGEIVPGSMPTTGQLTGDLGILAQERGASTRRPAAFAERRADQNAARLDAMEAIQPAGAPEMVTSTLRKRLAGIDRAEEDAFISAQSAARTSAEALGRGDATGRSR